MTTTAPTSNPSARGASTRKVGGVSHKRPIQPSSPASGQHAPDFQYNGGPVIRCPQVYGTFWGPNWLDNVHLNRAANLSQFLTDLLASTYMNIVSQYGVGLGAGVAGSYIKSSFVQNVGTQLDEASIHATIQSCINAGVIPEPPATGNNIALIIFLDETISVDDAGLGISMCEPTNDTAFGYHYDFVTAAGNEFYYAVIPALTDACLTNSCGTGGCSLSLSQPQEQRITQVTSHEFIEMCTDPKFPTGWYGSSSDENGDICNGQTDSITVGPNTWAVQRQYSKTDDVNSNGATYCVLNAPNPIPKLAGGPAAGTHIARIQMLQKLHGLLPLPTSTFDVKSNTLKTDPKQMEEFTQRLFAPFSHENLVPGLPGLLREFADHLDSKKSKK